MESTKNKILNQIYCIKTRRYEGKFERAASVHETKAFCGTGFSRFDSLLCYELDDLFAEDRTRKYGGYLMENVYCLRRTT